MQPDVTGILDLPDDAFAELVRRLFSSNPSRADIELVQCLQAYVLADAQRKSRWALRLSALDAQTRRAIWTPARLAAAMAELAEGSDLAWGEEASTEAMSALEVLWSEGERWVRTSLAALREWLAEIVEDLDCQPVDMEVARASILALRRRLFRSGGASEPTKMEIPIRGHDIEALDASDFRLEAGPLRLERCVPADRSGLAGWRLRVELRLHMSDISKFGEGAGVLLVSDAPAVAFSATVMPMKEGTLVGEMDKLLWMRDAPAELSRQRFVAYIWRIPRKPTRKARR